MNVDHKTSIEELAIHQLEVLSIVLGSHPEIVGSMTVQEVSEELWDMGISPQPPVEMVKLTGEPVSRQESCSDSVSLALGELLSDDLAVRSGSLRRLFARLQEIDEGEYSWGDQICTNPKSLSQRFDGAQTAEGFLMRNHIGDSPDIRVDLELAEEYNKPVDPLRVSIVALYPSGAIRSVAANVSLSEKTLHLTIWDLLVFLDPDADQPTEDILPFWAPVTLFAIQS